MDDQPILIAGGGIGGLAAALGLARQGRPVRLFEQAPAFEEIGAGLQMSPNGVRALQALGAWEAVEGSCVIPSEIHMRDGLSGALLQRIQVHSRQRGGAGGRCQPPHQARRGGRVCQGAGASQSGHGGGTGGGGGDAVGLELLEGLREVMPGRLRGVSGRREG